MSIEEYEAYRSGLMLQNTTDHYRGGLGGSLSRGFCFFSGNVARWAQRLNGLVSFDVLLTVEVSPERVKESRGVYADYAANPFYPPKRAYTEYCTTQYSSKHFRFISADFSYSYNPRYISLKDNTFITHPATV